MTPTTDLQKLCRYYDPEATEYENILLEAGWRRRDYDRSRGAIVHQGPDEKMHVEYWIWFVTNELRAARVLELEAENKRLRASLKRMLLEFDFVIEANLIRDMRHEAAFVEARAAIKGGEI
jgi:hypothetical protein